MEPSTGRFAGVVIDDTEEVPSGAFAGERLEPAVEPKQEHSDAESAAASAATAEALVEPEVRVQKAPTAVGVPPQTVNFFAGEELADVPIAKKSRPLGLDADDNAPESQEVPQNGQISHSEGLLPDMYTPTGETKENTSTGLTEPSEAPSYDPLAPVAVVNTSTNEPKRKKAGVAKRSKGSTTSAAATAATTAAATSPIRPRTIFDDDAEPLTPLAKKLPENPVPTAPKAPRGRRIKEVGERTGKVTFGLIIGVLVGAFVGAWVLAAIGPWRVTSAGIVPRDIGAPLNDIPAGTEITMTQLGTVAPTGINQVIPVVMGASKATVVAPLINSAGVTYGYTVTCISGSCEPGLSFDIPNEAILGGS